MAIKGRICLKDKPTPSYDLYMGRENKWVELEGSKWGNPFVLKRESDREHVLQQYEEYVRARPDLIASLPELDGKILACWCKLTKKCHVDILIKLYDEFC